MSVALSIKGVDGLDDAMQVMGRAFEPAFGEAWTAAQCTGVLAMPGAALVIACDTEPLGFALIRTVIDEAELMLLAVVPEAREQGVGRALLEQSMRHARDGGARHYLLEVRSDNSALSLYRQLGLQQVGIRRNYYRGHDGIFRDALTYRRTLP